MNLTNLNSNNTICSLFEISNLTLIQVTKCYFHQLNLREPFSVIELAIIFITIMFNAIVIVLIKKNTSKPTLFDKILICHAIVDFSAGLIAMPIYHVYITFGYWPFNSIISRLWSSFDNSINTITNLNMLYLNWSRLRSIQNPVNYSKEWLLKSPFHIFIFMWLVSYSIWAPLVFIFDLEPYTLRVDYSSNIIELMFGLIFWFIPLFLILAISLRIFFYLARSSQIGNQTHKHVTNADRNKSIFERVFNYRLESQTVFTIIMLVYWVQWTIPCLINLFRSFIGLPDQLQSQLYWLTYTVCATDPITLLIFNPNVSFLKNKIERTTPH